MYVFAFAHHSMYVEVRQLVGGQFFPSTLWVLEISLRLSGHCAVSSALLLWVTYFLVEDGNC